MNEQATVEGHHSARAEQYAQGMLDGVISHMNAIGAPKVWRDLASKVLYPFLAIGADAQIDGVPASDFRKFTVWVCASILFEASTATSLSTGEDADITLVASAADMVQSVANRLGDMTQERIKQMKVM